MVNSETALKRWPTCDRFRKEVSHKSLKDQIVFTNFEDIVPLV